MRRLRPHRGGEDVPGRGCPMTAGGSAAAWAASERARARKGLWRKLTAWLGISAVARRADASAARKDVGAAGERATAALIDPLRREGWTVWHDMGIAGRKFNLDHVLASPCGTALAALPLWSSTRRSGGTRSRRGSCGAGCAAGRGTGTPRSRPWPGTRRSSPPRWGCRRTGCGRSSWSTARRWRVAPWRRLCRAFMVSCMSWVRTGWWGRCAGLHGFGTRGRRACWRPGSTGC